MIQRPTRVTTTLMLLTLACGVLASLGFTRALALGATQTAGFNSSWRGVFLGQVRCSWVTVLDAGGPAAIDAATVTNPTTQVTRSVTHILAQPIDGGGYLAVRLGYDDALTVTTSPVVKVFARRGGGAWELLLTRGGARSVTLTPHAADVTDGTLKYTAVANADIYDQLGCDEFLIAVETALAGTGDTSNSIVQARPL